MLEKPSTPALTSITKQAIRVSSNCSFHVISNKPYTHTYKAIPEVYKLDKYLGDS